MSAACRMGEVPLYCDMPVPDFIVNWFQKRADSQIMGLEMLSIALGRLLALNDLVRKSGLGPCEVSVHLPRTSGTAT